MSAMRFARQLHLLRARVQSIASLHAMKKFYDDGNITMGGRRPKRAARISFVARFFFIAKIDFP